MRLSKRPEELAVLRNYNTYYGGIWTSDPTCNSQTRSQLVQLTPLDSWRGRQRAEE